MAKKKLGELLIGEGVLNEDSLANALAEQRQWGGRLGSILIRLGLVNEAELAAVLERQLNVRCVTLRERDVDPELLESVPLDMARKYTVFPLRLVGKTMTLAMVNPLDIPTIDDLQFQLGVRVVPALALESEINRAIAVHYEGSLAEHLTPPAPVAEKALHESVVDFQPGSGGSVLESGTPVEPGAFAGAVFNENLVDLQAGSEGQRLNPEPSGAEDPHGGVPPSGEKPDRKAASHKDVVEALIRLLIRKGLFTKEELLDSLRRD